MNKYNNNIKTNIIYMSDYLELEEHTRYFFGDTRHPDIYNIYNNTRDTTWHEGEIQKELSTDIKNKELIPHDQRKTLLNILSFFAVGDGIVNETSGTDILPRITILEIQMVMRLFMAQEDVHNIVYTMLVNMYAIDDKEKNESLKSLTNMPSVMGKKNWSDKWSIDAKLAQVILCNVIIEGLFFSSSFCYIFWINLIHKGKLPGLAISNDWISRDEGNHTSFGIKLYKMSNKIPDDIVYQMFREAVAVESEFVREIFHDKRFAGMNNDLMIQYVKYEADTILWDLGYDKIYMVDNPFGFMNMKDSTIRHGDFHCRDISDYALNTTGEGGTLVFDDDF